MTRPRYNGPNPSAAEPRPVLLAAVRDFVRDAIACAGVLRVSLIGSLTTSKLVPKDADVLFTIDSEMELTRLARAGRRLKGQAQHINLGGDIFLSDAAARYLGRICARAISGPRRDAAGSAALLLQSCDRRKNQNRVTQGAVQLRLRASSPVHRS